MTSGRYDRYRDVRSPERNRLTTAERGLLRDAVEGFLLARSPEAEELAELGLGVSIVLDRAVDAHRVTPQAAARLHERIDACGRGGLALLAA